MKISNTCLLSLVFVFATMAPDAYSQAFVLAPDSKLWVEGTSNKDDWSVKAKEVKAMATRGEDGTVASLTLEVPSAQMVSEKSSIMDRLMHRTLKVNEHPTIVFEMKNLNPAEAENTAVAVGELTIAGVTQEVTVEVVQVTADDGTPRYAGSQTLKMTDFGMKPPSAMFGALHTGDEVTVRFDVGLVAEETGS